MRSGICFGERMNEKKNQKNSAEMKYFDKIQPISKRLQMELQIAYGQRFFVISRSFSLFFFFFLLLLILFSPLRFFFFVSCVGVFWCFGRVIAGGQTVTLK
eukprot:TRINITY_DN939_c1_g1_i2.p1 TRINITY_DN939_c1_g1~~TRINITY_DN939_c1_g1_i2.p1  ORF type:complete len:101 (-),score=0.59 TRINITY_DN939_c1_g1_i2:70-372(-)